MGIVDSSIRFFGCKREDEYEEEGCGCSILSGIVQGFGFLFRLVWRGKTENHLLPIHNTSREPLLAQSSDEGRRWQRDDVLCYQQIKKQRDPDLVPPSPRCTSAFKSNERKSEREIVDLLFYQQNQRAYRDLVLSIPSGLTKTCNSNSGKNGDSTRPLQSCNSSTAPRNEGMKKAQGNCPSTVKSQRSSTTIIGVVGSVKNGDSTRPLKSCNSSTVPRNEGFGGMKKAQGNCPSTVSDAKSQRSSITIIGVVGSGKNGDSTRPLQSCNSSTAPRNEGMKKAQGNCPSTTKSQRSSIPIVDVVGRGIGKERWIKHYSSGHRILLVGEGDFSFSTSLALAFSSASNIIATSLNSQEFLEKNYSRAASNIEKLRGSGCKVMHEVDATKMANHPLLGHVKFDRIIFNFPYAGLALKNLPRESQLRSHRRLVDEFLKNAREMISEDGEIHISHKTNGFHVEFKLESTASSHRLRLIEAVKFNCSDYPGYNTKYGFGGDNNFNCNPSKTYKFGIKKIQYY